MGFKEIFIFVVVGCTVGYYLRSQLRSNDSQSQIFFLWVLAVALPSITIVLTTTYQLTLPLIFLVTTYLLGIWLYQCWNPNVQAIPILSHEEEQKLKTCFPPALYHYQGLEHRESQIYCHGTLRSQNSQYAYDTISQNIYQNFGDRFICYLQESHPDNRGMYLDNHEDTHGNNTSYGFYLIPSHHSNQESHIVNHRKQWIASSVSMIVTAFTVMIVGANISHIEDLSFANLQTGISYLMGIALIVIARLTAQYVVTKRYKLNFCPPILLPCISGFGWLGSLHNRVAIPKNPKYQRHFLFELSVITAISSLGISIILLFLGNWFLIPTNTINTAINNEAAISASFLPYLNTFEVRNSIFITILQSVFSAGKTINDIDLLTSVSPLTLAGWTGLAISALQLLPFQYLDGGNLALAMFGYRQAVKISRIVRIVLLAIALIAQPWLQMYSLLLFLLPTPQPLIVNESIEISANRDLIGIILLIIALLTILPTSKSLLLS
ncbi:zinc metalloprotease [Pseudanabaena mucicola]|uniref:Site-2 protease family protein n=1 Tax=Pseudanabaena mucicola FACHB-723 TaxID=2692860 RepID=A0ABR7ZWF3_9CYAN|nr:hypothetical protein [Pseudanabaena mucicola]MBD2187723.1 hypothetical protein [Pseudanabaena mucicola FACHB-723]